MTCYFRHMKEIFAEIGFEPTSENKKDADRLIHQLLGVDYKNCSTTWKEVKIHLENDREAFIKGLKKALKPIR